ncbi:Uncharacterised protein [Acidipropionibacterium jensenii]|uniref:Uncharacterized protein n=1 Tax=Acidipropionibacterium jensenii TaxID=1749 RepID=A0A3S5EVE9_9ACTN|nr:Uncharacterised protein [Acidipropionibacterium jensenii]
MKGAAQIVTIQTTLQTLRASPSGRLWGPRAHSQRHAIHAPAPTSVPAPMRRAADVMNGPIIQNGEPKPS